MRSFIAAVAIAASGQHVVAASEAREPAKSRDGRVAISDPWIKLSPSVEEDGRVCLSGPASLGKACLRAPSSDWHWRRDRTRPVYICARNESLAEHFTLSASPRRRLSPEGVRSDLVRRIGSASSPQVRNIVAAADNHVVPGAIRYAYETVWSEGETHTTVGYVMPSGWVVSGEFDEPHEPATFVTFVASFVKR